MPIDSQVEVKQVRLVKGTGSQIAEARQAGEILETDLVAQTDAPDLVTANDAIIGATKCKITYDSKGLVTAGDDLNSSDITTALGYTPYDSTNPSGYTSNVGTVTSVNNILPVDGNVSLTMPTYIHEQGVASAVWTVQHNLNKYPSVTVVDSSDNVIVADIEYIDTNTVRISMVGASKGRAYLN